MQPFIGLQETKDGSILHYEIQGKTVFHLREIGPTILIRDIFVITFVLTLEWEDIQCKQV
jgi:hypothetical protein